jgi:hypothetical protein
MISLRCRICGPSPQDTPRLLAEMVETNLNMALILDKWVPRDMRLSAHLREAAAAEVQDPKTERYIDEVAEVQRYEAQNQAFFAELRSGFRVGGFVGPCVALAVSLTSLVVIMGMYKKAVVRLRRQLAVNKVLEALPEGRGLLEVCSSLIGNKGHSMAPSSSSTGML